MRPLPAASGEPDPAFGLELPPPSSFRPCRSSRLRRFAPHHALQVCCTLQPTMGFTSVSGTSNRFVCRHRQQPAAVAASRLRLRIACPVQDAELMQPKPPSPQSEQCPFPGSAGPFGAFPSCDSRTSPSEEGRPCTLSPSPRRRSRAPSASEEMLEVLRVDPADLRVFLRRRVRCADTRCRAPPPDAPMGLVSTWSPPPLETRGCGPAGDTDPNSSRYHPWSGAYRRHAAARGPRRRSRL
jgi:hypothetical protein